MMVLNKRRNATQAKSKYKNFKFFSSEVQTQNLAKYLVLYSDVDPHWSNADPDPGRIQDNKIPNLISNHLDKLLF